MLAKHAEKNLNGNGKRMLREQILENSSKQQLHGHIPTKLDEQDMQGTAGDLETNLLTTFFHELLYVDTPMLADQQRFTSTLCGHWVQPGGIAWSDGW